MTELRESTRSESARATGISDDDAVARTAPIPVTATDARPDRKGGSFDARTGIGWLVCGVAGTLTIAWYILAAPGELGSKAEWFFGAVVFVAVAVTMWQTVTFARQAQHDAADAAEKLRAELAAADQRAALELASAKKRHRTELEAQQKLHASEMAAQREIARIERRHLADQLQKQAMIEVSRSVATHTRMLASLWSEGARCMALEDRAEREKAMNAIFEQIGHVVTEVSVEIDNAHLLCQDDRLHEALDRVNDAVLMAIRTAEELHDDVLQGRTPQEGAVREARRRLTERATEARRLAWSLLRTGLERNGVERTGPDSPEVAGA
ncbi:hypothetical protein LT350_31350 [Mycolicibacterium smegmatis]|uniref:hypothetical protein n=1 Tax=Mycolicibacterium smegmatis TaxID=1772 RepID=UPI001E349B53|nr:hypothetical protein [Mycolicibacterium smegmatis]UGU30948.1 hypothetical protein LT350_31350 [Mycolicibacterium smegmatis]ULN71854.1 hypothetical protein KZ782_08120 [Mycolicibacterium smegmatis]